MGKHPRRSLYFYKNCEFKLATLIKEVVVHHSYFYGNFQCLKYLMKKPATLFKKRLRHSCFLMNFVKYLKHFFYRTPPGDCFLRKIHFLPFCNILGNVMRKYFRSIESPVNWFTLEINWLVCIRWKTFITLFDALRSGQKKKKKSDPTHFPVDIFCESV